MEDFSNVQSGHSSTAPRTAIFEYETPEGILEWEGPEDTPPAVVKQHFAAHLAKQPSAGEGLSNLYNMARHPLDTLGGMAQEAARLVHPLDNMDQGADLEKARGGSDLSQAFHGVVNALPGGTHLNELMTQSNTNLPGAVAQAGTEIVGSEALGSAIGKVPGAVSSRVKGVTGLPSDVLLERAKAATAKTQPLSQTAESLVRSVGNAKPLDTAGALFNTGADLLNRAKAAVYNRLAPRAAAREAAAARMPQALPALSAPPDFVPTEQSMTRQPRQAASTPYQGNAMEGVYQEPPAASMQVEAAPTMPVNPDVVELQQQIRPSGKAAQTWVARNASELYNLMPELRGVPLSEKFRVLATNGFKNLESEMKAAQASVPPSTVVPKEALVDGLLPIKADALMANRPAVLRLIEKLDDMPPNIPWDDFLDIKEGIRKASSFGSDPFVRKAYGQFMDAASRVSTNLAKANKNFSIGMRLLEHSKIDPISGQFLKQP